MGLIVTLELQKEQTTKAHIDRKIQKPTICSKTNNNNNKRIHIVISQNIELFSIRLIEAYDKHFHLVQLQSVRPLFLQDFTITTAMPHLGAGVTADISQETRHQAKPRQDLARTSSATINFFSKELQRTINSALR